MLLHSVGPEDGEYCILERKHGLTDLRLLLSETSSERTSPSNQQNAKTIPSPELAVNCSICGSKFIVSYANS